MKIGQKDFIERLNGHEVSAFHELYQKYFRLLVLFAMRFTDEQMVAEDVVEDVIVALYEQEEKFDNLLSFQTYLYNAVRNRMLNHLKHESVHQKFSEHYQATESGVIAQPQDLDVSFEEMYVALFEEMESLPPRCREVLLLYTEGKSNAEIAAALDLSIETVKTHRKRALRVLRERMDKLVLFVFFMHLCQF